MTFGRMQVHHEMEVVGTGGQPIGRVSEVHEEIFRVVRQGREDVAIPYEAIRAMIGEQTVLGVQANDVDAQGRSSPTADRPPGE